MDDADTLAEAISRHSISLPEEQIARLDVYCRALWQWNEKLNLTRHTDYEKFVARDLVDSLELAKVLAQGERVLDVGTGGGVPGVVLAILRPDLRITLSESVVKRAKALGDIVGQTGLKLTMLEGRVESTLKGKRFDTLVARAVARMAKILAWLQPHWSTFDRLLLIKGPAWVEERGEARHVGLFRDLALRKIASYPLSGTTSESVVLLICRKEKLARFWDHGADEET